MARWLVIALRAPFASFADAPGNTTRKTGDMPSRSALLGLAAAALGIRRDDEAGQVELSNALVTASALIAPGAIMTDFHTYASLHQAAKGAATRAEALRKKEHVVTSITRRDYRTDALWQGAYRLSERLGSLTLDGIAAAFQRPAFFLSIGRRACAPSHPLNPSILDATDVRDAFAAHAASMPTLEARPALLYSLETRADVPGANRRFVEHRRRDDPRDRSIRWTFADRPEWRLAAETTAEDTAP
ncbi:MAG: type I-E CRISPR-associated protein Cas5/CasD [Mesorhizobium sp.]